jgi:hypothetical protein
MKVYELSSNFATHSVKNTISKDLQLSRFRNEMFDAFRKDGIPISRERVEAIAVFCFNGKKRDFVKVEGMRWCDIDWEEIMEAWNL